MPKDRHTEEYPQAPGGPGLAGEGPDDFTFTVPEPTTALPLTCGVVGLGGGGGCTSRNLRFGVLGARQLAPQAQQLARP